MTISTRIEADSRLFPSGVSDAGPYKRGEEPLAVGMEYSVVILGDDLVAAEDDNSSPLLQEIIQGSDFGLTELSDIAKNDCVIRSQLAAGQL